MKADGHEYGESDFWTKKGDQLTAVGDYLGRLPALHLLDPKPGERILDAGCGAGFMARRIAGLGAEVWGVDRIQSMLDRAIEIEKFNPQGIRYVLGNIASSNLGIVTDDCLECGHSGVSFDAIICVGVLMHDTPEECDSFLNSAYHNLRKGGRLIISITHPDLYPIEHLYWIRHRTLGEARSKGSVLYREEYLVSPGHWFISNVWCHTEEFMHTLLAQNGLTTIVIRSMCMTPEVIKLCKITDGQTGYPVIWQVLAEKK